MKRKGFRRLTKFWKDYSQSLWSFLLRLTTDNWERTTVKAMSALGGIYNFDGAPVDKGVLSALGSSLVNRGPDGGGEYAVGSVGMVYRAFNTNRESRVEVQPLVSRYGHVLSWDGRLDNRDDLINILRGDLYGDHTDVAIVMASYLRWGLDFASRIIGDFALSLWDPILRALLLARDPVGPRTLYYHSSENTFIWSTELSALLDFAGIELQINDEYVADFLTRYPEPRQTPYKNIEGVPPAHVVIARIGVVTVQRFWDFDPKHEIRYKTDAEYEEQFRYLFREAVHCRLRSDRPVWAELSGGLDSSSLACMASDIIGKGQAQAPGLETVSLVYDECRGSDEREYIRCVEERIGKGGLHLREDDYRMLAPLPADYTPVIPNHVAKHATYHRALNEATLRAGARVRLSGQGGDEILTSARDPSPELADLLASCNLLKLHNRLRVWSQALKKPYLKMLWKKTIVPSLPPGIQKALRREFIPRGIYDPNFVKQMNLRRHALGKPETLGLPHNTRKQWHVNYSRMVKALSAGYWREFSQADLSYPYTHRPLVEFMAAIPFEQRVRPHEARSLLRRAMRDLLPADIVGRQTKARDTDAALRAISREYERLRAMYTDARMCAHGYVSRQGLLKVLELGGQGHYPSACMLWFLFPLESWLRALEARKSIAVDRSPNVRYQADRDGAS